MTSPLPPPAWHPDPTGRHELRYWDGTRWSAHVSDGGRVGADDLAARRTVGTEPVPLGEEPPSVPTTTGGFLDPTIRRSTPTAPGAPPSMMRSIGGLASSLTVVLWISFAVATFGVVAFANRVAVANDILDFDFGSGTIAEIYDLQQRADDADDLVGAAVTLMGLCSITILVLLIIWMWRVAKNAELAGRDRPRFGAGWAIGGWFIPFANLVIPVLVVQDLWRASDPTVPRGDPAWRRAHGSALVGWWWAAYLVATIRFGGGGDAATRDQLESLRTYDLVATVGMLAAAAAAVLLISVVRSITRRQEALLTGPPLAPAPKSDLQGRLFHP